MADKSLSYLTNCVVKFAEDSHLIQKDVKDIRDVICGSKLDKVITSIYESLNSKNKERVSLKPLKGPSIDNRDLKRSNKETNKLLGQILKKLDGKQGRIRGGDIKLDTSKDKNLKNMFGGIMLAERLKNISLKDLIAGKSKMKPLKKITQRALDIFHMFKDEKELKNTMDFLDKAIDISKRLKKVALLSSLSKKGAKTIETLFFGKRRGGGLVGIMERLSGKEGKIKKGERMMTSIRKATLSVLGLCVTTIGIGLLAIPAAVGIGVSSLIVVGLTKIFEHTGKKLAKIEKGVAAFASMSAGLAVFSLGLVILTKSTKDLSWKQCGIMLAAMTGVGLAMAGIGLLAAPIVLGSGVMVLMGASLGILALSLLPWKKFDAKPAMDNIRTTISGLKNIFGLEKETKEGEPEPGFFKKIGTSLKAGVEGLCGVIGGIGQFAQIATIAAGVLMMDVIRLALIPWETYDSTKAANNIFRNMGILKNAFFPREEVKNGEERKSFGKNLLKSLKSGVQGLCDTLDGAGQFTSLATIAAAITTMDVIRLALIPWETYDTTKAADNVIKNMGILKNAFFPKVEKKESEKKGFLKSIGSGLKNGLKGVCDVLDGVGQFAEIAAISAATLTMDVIRLALIPWNNYDSKPAVNNIQDMMSGLRKAFSGNGNTTTSIDADELKVKTNIISKFIKDINKHPLNREFISTPLEKSVNAINSIDIEKASVMKDLFESFRKLNGGSLLNGFGTSVDKFVAACRGFMNSVNNFSNKSVETETETVEVSPVSTEPQEKKEKGININNTKQLAEAIAEAMKNLNIKINPNMIDVNLVADSTSGKRVTLSILE